MTWPTPSKRATRSRTRSACPTVTVCSCSSRAGEAAGSRCTGKTTCVCAGCRRATWLAMRCSRWCSCSSSRRCTRRTTSRGWQCTQRRVDIGFTSSRITTLEGPSRHCYTSGGCHSPPLRRRHRRHHRLRFRRHRRSAAGSFILRAAPTNRPSTRPPMRGCVTRGARRTPTPGQRRAVLSVRQTTMAGAV